MTRPLSRRRAIEAAIAAHNSADNETVLPPSAVRLLAVMFPRDVCQRSVADLEAEGFDRRTVRSLLRALVDAGFLSSERPWGAVPNIYRLHLPPVQS